MQYQISICTTFDNPCLNHQYAVVGGNGEYCWDTVMDEQLHKPRKQFKADHIENAFHRMSVTEKCASSFPSYVYNIQFLYNGVWYRMFLVICGGKFQLFYNIAVPYNGSKFLRLKSVGESEHVITELTFPFSGNGNYPSAYYENMRFLAHRMVLYLWGGPNNASDEDWKTMASLEGDHVDNDLYNWSILFLQWLTAMKNKSRNLRL